MTAKGVATFAWNKDGVFCITDRTRDSYFAKIMLRSANALKVIAYAEAARVWAKQSKLGTAAINHATLIKIKAEQRLAECVDAGQARGEIAKPATARAVSSPKNGEDRPLTLADLGTTSQRLDEARKLRSLSAADLAAAAEKAAADDKPNSRGAFLREIRRSSVAI